jgi:penicillin-binding protein 2
MRLPFFSRQRNPRLVEVDEIFLDSSNIPAFDQMRLEGKRELPITRGSLALVGFAFMVVAGLFLSKVYTLQVVKGSDFSAIADNNSVSQTAIIAERGVIYDRRGEMVAWNERDEKGLYDFPIRAYTDALGMGHVLGYVSYPQRDKKGFFYRTEYEGISGAESAYDEQLKGKNGKKIISVDALGNIVSEHSIDAAVPGQPLTLSIDAGLSEAMYQIIATSSASAGFRSGAGAIMDIHTGEILALTSFPSYDPEIMADGDDTATIDTYNNDERLPFLNKVIGGVYTPGSIVKPFVAYGALAEGIVTPEKQFVSTGEIVVPNPYNPENPSRFTDWRAHGIMNMREAIAYSSNVYFYIVGGGFGEQRGLGITKMADYYHRFGLGSTTGIILGEEQPGVVPDPAWKKKEFDDDWRLGDTYFTAIGQFGFLTTPLQMLRAYGAIATGGTLVTPHVVKGAQGEVKTIALDPAKLRVIHEGMRMTTNYPGGTARSLERPLVAIAAKSGTAEVGAGNAYVNSWAAGFFPYENPQYAFIMMMDRAPRSNMLGATRIMGEVVKWMEVERPEYLGIKTGEGEDINP